MAPGLHDYSWLVPLRPLSLLAAIKWELLLISHRLIGEVELLNNFLFLLKEVQELDVVDAAARQLMSFD